MTREEIIEGLKLLEDNMVYFDELLNDKGEYIDVHELLFEAIEVLEQESCEDCISRKAVLDCFKKWQPYMATRIFEYEQELKALPIIQPKPKTGYCKECKYFEYDSVAKVDGIPLIVAHEICKKWGDGCKTSEDGYCFLFEPQESEDKECK